MLQNCRLGRQNTPPFALQFVGLSIPLPQPYFLSQPFPPHARAFRKNAFAVSSEVFPWGSHSARSGNAMGREVLSRLCARSVCADAGAAEALEAEVVEMSTAPAPAPTGETGSINHNALASEATPASASAPPPTPTPTNRPSTAFPDTSLTQTATSSTLQMRTDAFAVRASRAAGPEGGGGGGRKDKRGV